MKFFLSIIVPLFSLYFPYSEAFEISAKPGMANMVNAKEDASSGERTVSIALTNADTDSKWAAAVTCGVADPNNEQSAVLVRLIQDLPADRELYFVFSHFDNGNLERQEVLVKGVKFGEVLNFNLKWSNNVVKIIRADYPPIEIPINFSVARFYCGISSGTASLDIKT